MEITQLEIKDIQRGQPKILSTVGKIEFKEPYIEKINSEYISLSEIIPGKPKIFNSVPGVKGHENLPRPYFSMQQMLKTWDNFNGNLYQVICKTKDLNE